MKKLSFTFSIINLCFAIALCLTPIEIHAHAKVEYRRIITDDTPFYSDVSGTNLLFYLPYTYYVKIIETGELYTHVECYGTGNSVALDGYVPTNSLFNDGLTIIDPYLDKSVTTVTTAVLYLDKNLSTPLQYVFATRTLKYYGQFTAQDGSIIFYVEYNNKLGYVEESVILPFEIDLHPNELTFLQPELPPDGNLSTEQPTPSQPEGITTLRIIVIASLILAGLVALFIALKNKPKKKLNSGYYDENEYE